jgi:Rab GDP dissociation inhibitor
VRLFCFLTPFTYNSFLVSHFTQALYAAYGLDTYTQEFIGHTMAMFTTEAYLQEPAAQLIEALQLYSISLQVRRGLQGSEAL